MKFLGAFFRLSGNMAPESAFLGFLFEFLRREGIFYVVMRNYQGLPATVGRSDLDILIDGDALERVVGGIEDSACSAGGCVIGISRAADVAKIHALGRLVGQQAIGWGVCVDLFPGLSYAGIGLLARGVSVPVDLHNGISVLPAPYAGLIGVLKEALHNGWFATRYGAEAAEAVASDWPRVQQVFQPLGERALARLKDMLAASATDAERSAHCAQIRRDVLLHALRHRPFALFKGGLQTRQRKLSRYANPAGAVVAVLGVDGAGKSTMIEGITPVLQAATHGAMTVRHLRPGVLPPLSRLKGRVGTPGQPVVDPHAHVPSGVAGSLFRLAYLALDYQVGYWLRTRVEISRLPTVVVFDRYAYDLEMDQRRFRIGLSGWVARMFSALAPRPDLVICLVGDPERIAERKKELSVQETRRQLAWMHDFARRTPRATLVSTDQSINGSLHDVLQAIITAMRQRRKNVV